MLAYRSMLLARIKLWVQGAGFLLLVALMRRDLDPVVTWFAALPWAVHTLLALSWPVLAGLIASQWQLRLGAYRWSPAAPRANLTASLDRTMRRYSPLDANGKWQGDPGSNVITLGSRLSWLLNAALPLYLFMNYLSPLGWEQASDARHLLSLGLLAVFMTSALVARDLHWRSLLMPGGWRRGRIATDIFLSTVRGAVPRASPRHLLMYVLWQRLFMKLPLPPRWPPSQAMPWCWRKSRLPSAAALVIRSHAATTLQWPWW